MTWQKSSYSSSTANCVEVAVLPEQVTWRKSSRSSSQANCVEVATAEAVIGVRDSKNTSGPVLVFADRPWTAFLKAVR